MKKSIYVILLVILLITILYLELTLREKYAPETLLILVLDDNGNPETQANCFGNIISSKVNVEKKPLVTLDSVYEFLDPSIFYLKNSKGYYYFETGFDNYKDDFEIRIVCYSPQLRGVSYTIINNTNSNCEFRKDGKVAFC